MLPKTITKKNIPFKDMSSVIWILEVRKQQGGVICLMPCPESFCVWGVRGASSNVKVKYRWLQAIFNIIFFYFLFFTRGTIAKLWNISARPLRQQNLWRACPWWLKQRVTVASPRLISWWCRSTATLRRRPIRSACSACWHGSKTEVTCALTLSQPVRQCLWNTLVLHCPQHLSHFSCRVLFNYFPGLILGRKGGWALLLCALVLEAN